MKAQRISLLSYQFNSYNQKENEPFDTYITELSNKIKQCEYGQLEDSLLRDRLVFWNI